MEQNLNLYQIFYEVGKCHNFSVAAKKLYISQPAISKSIAKLEEYLNTILFHRSSRGVTLTTEGELLFKQVETALLSIRSGEQLLKYASLQGITHLSIGVSTTLCKYVLLPLLKGFMIENPKIQLSISCQSTFETIEAINSGTIDIGLVGIPTNESNATYLPLKDIQDIFVATDSYFHQLSGLSGKELSFKEDFIKNASFIMLDKGNISRKYADAYLANHNIIPSNIIEVNNMDLSIEFARSGLGIACVISDFVKGDLQKGTLQEIKFPYKVPKRQIGFVYPEKVTCSAPLDSLIRYYQDNLSGKF